MKWKHGSEEFEQQLYDGVNVWDDDDIEKSLSKSKGYESTNAFTTDEVFRTRDELLKWVRKVAFDIGFCIVILRSDTSTGQRGRKTFVLLGCERGGQYKPYKKDLQVTESGTRKCGCPFRLRGYPVKSDEGWILKLICGSHNHELANTLVVHPYAGRFTCSEKSMLMDMTDSLVKPRNILLTMKEHNEKNVSTIKQVYNARYMFEEGTNVMQDLFWTHPDSVKLLNAFNIVLMMDSTYKTNRYKMPLFEVVGVTSTGLTFSAAFMLLASERHHNFVWALEKLKDKSHCGCTIRSTHGLPCACELASFGVGSIPLQSVHLIWTRLSFLDISSDDTSAELSIQQEWAVIMNRFKEVDMAGKINIKAKLREIAYPDNTSLCPPREKVKTKGALKGR
ncbi:PKS-NRPS hybrid synthetase cheA-like [Phaseolus vulgaris]|uniref:PKS-NRPS hybrid synthetase cheA-like n=1 Tax=Phaseolus vulgaris TaxID=3885 RepID=UPI0035CC5AE7